MVNDRDELAKELYDNLDLLYHRGEIHTDDDDIRIISEYFAASILSREKSLRSELDMANLVKNNPDKWMKWCDEKVLEQNEELKKELAQSIEQLDKMHKFSDVRDDEIIAEVRDEFRKVLEAIKERFYKITPEWNGLVLIQDDHYTPPKNLTVVPLLEIITSELAKLEGKE